MADGGRMAVTGGRLCVYNGGLLDSRVRRILQLSGWALRPGLPPAAGDTVGVWGASPTAWRGLGMARRAGRPVLRIEDAFLRSLHPGRSGAAPLGLLLDGRGVHFDPRTPSDLELLLATHPLDDPALLARAAQVREVWRREDLSKYAATDPALPLPGGPYTLVIDQTRGDASVTASGGTEADFRAMLEEARMAAPDLPVVIKAHPETRLGHRPGYLAATDLPPGTVVVDEPVGIGELFARAHSVHTFSSGLGFEAILHGLRPHVRGRPFYAGWGLTEDRAPLPRRGRELTADQLTAAALILYPTWYDPIGDRLCEVEDAMRQLAAEARAWREDRAGWAISGQWGWKRPHLRRFFGQHRRVVFGPERKGRKKMVWGTTEAEGPVTRVEDGFIRSRGLGVRLVPSASFSLDDLGLHFDPSRESRLERLIGESPGLPPAEIERVRALIAAITGAGLSKYNTGANPVPELPPGRRILVAGQVEDDASVVLGGGRVRQNGDLLAMARAARPGDVIVYAPHPDVTSGLRPGHIPAREADVIAAGCAAPEMIAAVDEVWTMTSLIGFETLLRGKPVVVTGAPFYSGWGLTEDLGCVPARRVARPTLEQLAHATLIGYPRYNDPVTGLPCPPEAIVRRLIAGETPRSGGLLGRLQDMRRYLRT